MRLIGHEVDDHGEEQAAEDRHGDVGKRHRRVVRLQAVPPIEVLLLQDVHLRRD